MKRLTLVVALTTLACMVLATSSLLAGPKRGVARRPKEVTLTGRLVDLRCTMTEKYPSSDRVRCTQECIRAGVPVALQTKDGLVVVDGGKDYPREQLLPLAYQEVQLQGKLYQKYGLKYLEIAGLQPAKAARMDDQGDEEEMDEDDYQDEEEDEEGDERGWRPDPDEDED